MSPELEQAIRERIELGHTKEQIAAEMSTAGYDQATTDAIYASIVGNSDATQHTPMPAAALPTGGSLVKAAWAYMTSNLNLVMLIAAPSLAIGVLDYVSSYSSVDVGSAGLIAIALGSFALVVLMILFQVALIRMVLTSLRGATTTFGESFVWARSNFFAWLWVAVLSGLVIMGGWALLIVPGIIASTYLLAAQYVFVDEGVRGMAALQRSRALTYGRFWPVTWRLFVMMLVAIALFIPLGILVAVTATSAVGVSVVVFVEGILSGVVGVFATHYIGNLYLSLQSTQTTTVAPTAWYKVFAVLGVLFVLAIVGLIATGAAMYNEFDELNPAELEALSNGAELSPEVQAEMEAFMQQFEGEFDSY